MPAYKSMLCEVGEVFACENKAQSRSIVLVLECKHELGQGHASGSLKHVVLMNHCHDAVIHAYSSFAPSVALSLRR